jgi:hypothetical protein
MEIDEPELKKRIKEKATKGTISCSEALQIAKDMKIPARAVGKTLDEMNIRIKKCQLGCFE